MRERRETRSCPPTPTLASENPSQGSQSSQGWPPPPSPVQMSSVPFQEEGKVTSLGSSHRHRWCEKWRWGTLELGVVHRLCERTWSTHGRVGIGMGLYKYSIIEMPRFCCYVQPRLSRFEIPLCHLPAGQRPAGQLPRSSLCLFSPNMDDNSTFLMGFLGFCHNSVGKESFCKAGDPGSIPGWGRPPGEGISYPLQYSWASLVVQLVKNLPAMRKTWFDPWVGKIPWSREQLPPPEF